jgi:hypothetical protein
MQQASHGSKHRYIRKVAIIVENGNVDINRPYLQRLENQPAFNCSHTHFRA